MAVVLTDLKAGKTEERELLNPSVRARRAPAAHLDRDRDFFARRGCGEPRAGDRQPPGRREVDRRSAKRTAPFTVIRVFERAFVRADGTVCRRTDVVYYKKKKKELSCYGPKVAWWGVGERC